MRTPLTNAQRSKRKRAKKRRKGEREYRRYMKAEIHKMVDAYVDELEAKCLTT